MPGKFLVYSILVYIFIAPELVSGTQVAFNITGTVKVTEVVEYEQDPLLIYFATWAERQSQMVDWHYKQLKDAGARKTELSSAFAKLLGIRDFYHQLQNDSQRKMTLIRGWSGNLGEPIALQCRSNEHLDFANKIQIGDIGSFDAKIETRSIKQLVGNKINWKGEKHSYAPELSKKEIYAYALNQSPDNWIDQPLQEIRSNNPSFGESSVDRLKKYLGKSTTVLVSGEIIIPTQLQIESELPPIWINTPDSFVFPWDIYEDPNFKDIHIQTTKSDSDDRPVLSVMLEVEEDVGVQLFDVVIHIYELDVAGQKSKRVTDDEGFHLGGSNNGCFGPGQLAISQTQEFPIMEQLHPHGYSAEILHVLKYGKDIKTKSAETRALVGQWWDDQLSFVRSIYKTKHGYILTYSQDEDETKGITLTKSSSVRYETFNDFGEYYTIDGNGNLQLWDHDGYFRTYSEYTNYITTAKANQDTVTYTIVGEDVIRGIKRGVDVRISRPVTEEELKRIAYEVKSMDKRRFERILIHYWLPNQVIGSGSWAISYFTPMLEIQIQGETSEQYDRRLDRLDDQDESPVTPDDEIVVGIWRDNSPYIYGLRKIVRRGSKYFFIAKFDFDGTSIELEYLMSETTSGQRFDRKKPRANPEWMIINADGDLETWDRDGLVGIDKKTR